MDQLSRDKVDPQRLLAALLLDTDQERLAALSELDAVKTCGDVLFALLERLRRLDELERDFSTKLQHEKLESLRELAYGASHEINNPLANIATRAQALLREEGAPERQRKLATINSQAFRAHEMISDMMLFAKPPDLIREPICLAKLIRDVIACVAAAAAEQGTEVVGHGLEHECVISADANHLTVALQALLRNSLEALEMGGRVTVTLLGAAIAPDGAVTLAVADTGPGIPPEVRRHLFDPFYSGREAGRGLGFGLSKCWRIITLHGGSIDADSHDGQGARFTIRLPRGVVSDPVPALAHG